MRSGRLAGVVVANLRRSRNHFLLASIGIVVGIATFTFFIALAQGVRAVVLGKIFPLDQLEIVPRSLDVELGPLAIGSSTFGNDIIDDAKVAEIAAIKGVSTVYPKMRLTVPSIAWGGEELLGANLRTELVADGINPALVQTDVGPGFEFRDFEDPNDERNKEKPKVCEKDEDCGKHMYCAYPAGTKLKRRNSDDDTGKAPPGTEWVCRHPVPILASEHVVELYNGALRRAHHLPKLVPESVLGFQFELVLGSSMVEASNKDYLVNDRAMLVGFSKKAIALGLTMPVQYVQRYNVEFGSPEDAQRYHSVIVMVPEKDDVAAVAKAVQDMNLDVADTGAEQAALLIAIFTLIFALVSAVIVGIAAVNIMHVFFMLVYERQHEIGIMRAVGASRGDISRIILGEAAILGFVAGLAGVAIAFGASLLFDWVSTNYVPDFPYKPDTYFVFPWWLLLAALAFAVSFCIFGAFLPARRAARMEPAMVLSGH
ncbi:MAG TPA: FtsX-like permease family protein [Nannocystaceae bacterium]|nr:FtsX-like permease family protein [Nannocystaceae bacterium]